MAFEHERDIAVEAAIQAGNLIRMHAGRLSNEQIREKSLHNLLTVVDDEAQRLIMSLLMDAFPAYGFLAEEQTEHHNKPGNARWIIDPIDGTTNFAHGVPPYAVSIALQVEREVVVGVILDVSRDELFTAIRGDGFYVNGVRKEVSSYSTLQQSLLTTGFPFREWAHIDAYLEVLRHFMGTAQAVRRTGASVIDLAYLAAGRFDGVFKMGYEIWDVAAGGLMIEEAGGTVTDFLGGDTWLTGGRLVASNGLIHQQLLDGVVALQEI
ncbi:MAG TPA: inositol monophosphatase family protein [Rhodothermales bacterium]|nr:inositol monophosphatase [Bacteroidota bacterium]HRK74580.1 inositol monophosphatase family protein [Rhodothermales bacterium]HRR08252.1 inositol monophosphatase family protein [Rhodothermales bacterium]